MKNYKKKISIIATTFFSVFSAPVNAKGNLLEVESFNNMVTDNNSALKILEIDTDDDEWDDWDTFQKKKNKKLPHQLDNMVDSFVPPILNDGIKKNLEDKLDIATSPSRWWDLLVGFVSTRLVLNIFDVFIGDNWLNRDVLSEIKPKQQDLPRDTDNILQDLKFIYSGLGWVDNMELPILSKVYNIFSNYINFYSYYALSAISKIPLEKINYRRIMAEKFSTTWGYTMAWDYILKELGFCTKVYRIKENDQYFFEEEYVILFKKNSETKIYLLTPFYAKKTNKVDNLYFDKPTGRISTTISPKENKYYELISTDNPNEIVKITLDIELKDILNFNNVNNVTKFTNKL